MACDSVATVTSKLKADAGLVLDSEPAITAVGALLAEAIGPARNVEAYTYEQSQVWYIAGCQLVLSRNGNIQFTSSRYNMTQDERDRILAAITLGIGQVAGMLAQAKAVLAIQQAFGSQIAEQQMTQQGAAVIMLSL